MNRYKWNWDDIEFERGELLHKQTDKFSNGTIPFADSEDFYGWMDKVLLKAMPIGGKRPPGAKGVGRGIELKLYQSLQDTVDGYLKKLVGNEKDHEVIDGLRNVMQDWSEKNMPQADAAFDKLFRLGFKAGVISGAGKLGVSDAIAMEVIKKGLYRIGDRIKLFADDAVLDFAKTITKAYTPEGTFSIDHMVKEMNKTVIAKRYELERIARTETGQVTNIGRLWAWEQDPERFFYKYHWRSTPDSRRRIMKKMRSDGNPFSYDEIKFLFLHNEQFVPELNKWQMGAINCRCTITREPSEEETLGNRFAGQEQFFRKTVDIAF